MASLDYVQSVSARYGRRDLETAILDALRAVGTDLDSLTTDDLAPLTHFHPLGAPGSLALARLAGLGRDMEVLDLGSGLGGPARTLATTFDCRVTGLDLTAECVRAANALTARVGLNNLVTFRQGNALDIPFADGSFNLVWTEQFAMHVADKQRLYSQVYRVMRPGGRLAMREFLAGPVQPIHYPVPWAEDSAISFLCTAEDLRVLLAGIGFSELAWEDLTPAMIARLQSGGQLVPTRLPTAADYCMVMASGPCARTCAATTSRTASRSSRPCSSGPERRGSEHLLRRMFCLAVLAPFKHRRGLLECGRTLPRPASSPPRPFDHHTTRPSTLPNPSPGANIVVPVSVNSVNSVTTVRNTLPSWSPWSS
jgi:SAM-dependent methyltransferase